jgi:hypothetical protein
MTSSPILPPPITPLAAILPTEPLLLMGAGPVPIPQAVAQANGVIINHLGPTMDRVIQNVKHMAAYAFQTRSDICIEILKAFNNADIQLAYPAQTSFTAAPDGSLIMPYPDVTLVATEDGKMDSEAGEAAAKVSETGAAVD